MSISVRRDGTAGTRHTVHVRNHAFAVDASPAGGGADAGPSPHDLYDAALASCKALTVLLYAQRKNMPVEFLSPALALPKFQPGTVFRMLVGESFIGDGRVLQVLDASAA